LESSEPEQPPSNPATATIIKQARRIIATSERID
jgi:hypothetical protein